MELTQLYDRLTAVPLFRGLSAEDFTNIADRVSLRWVTVVAGQPVIQSEEPCHHLVFLCEGTLLRTTHHDNKTYTVTDLVEPAQVIEPERLYGLSTCYRSNYRAQTTSRLLLIPKEEVHRILLAIPIWRINFLNLLATQCNRNHQAMLPRIYNLREQVLHFGSPKPLSIRIRMSDLGKYIGAARKTVSNLLHQLEDEGLVHLRPNLIEFTYKE
ncbi:MAG: Crp/Fnr family transcriptional regulator [Bacteroidales bacterium]|nr:Crp/Fnr family transcriptional regulator [Candidatus Physcousia equi]